MCRPAVFIFDLKMMKAILSLFVIFLAGCTSEANGSNATLTSSRFGEWNIYHVYDRDNSRAGLRIYPTAVSVNTFRTFRTKTVVIVHDHEGSGTTTLNPTLKDAFLHSDDVTVIVVDWSFMASQSYANAAGAARGVGEGIAELIRLLIARNQINLARLHLVGFGLGAHVCAFTARTLNGVVARITGLDPSRELWTTNTERLRLSDAAYVEVIHTDVENTTAGEAQGIGEPLGHVDFFPNGGTSHPGCSNEHDCNHRRAWEFFAASLTHRGLAGNQCASEDISDTNCQGYTVDFGNNEMNKYGTGVFYLETTRTYPYDQQDNCLQPCIVP